MTDRREHHEAIGAAIERAAAELPEGCDLHIEIERHAGNVVLYLPNSDASKSDFEGHETFADQINAAIDWAIERYSVFDKCECKVTNLDGICVECGEEVAA